MNKKGKLFSYLNRSAIIIGLLSCNLWTLDIIAKDKRIHIIFMICITVFYILSFITENSYNNLIKRIEELEETIDSKGE